VADHVIAKDELGAYEISLEAGTKTTVETGSTAATINSSVIVTVNSGTAPVYARRGNAVTVADPKATQIPPSTWADIPTGTGAGVIALISAEDAVVSVARS
jgi:hypothetical protein